MLNPMVLLQFEPCVVINMHWKVLCVDPMGPLRVVLMYSIYSGLFSLGSVPHVSGIYCALTWEAGPV